MSYYFFGSVVERSILDKQISGSSFEYTVKLFFCFAFFLPVLKPIRFIAVDLPGSPPC